MALFKKNIWSLYALIVLLTLILFAVLGVTKWQANRDDFIEQQHIQVELFSSSVSSLLTSQEALLEVVGHQLAQQSDFTRTASIQIRPILDKLLDTHPAIAAFGLLNPQGDYLAISSNLQLSDQHNLLNHPYTRDSFLAAMSSEKMVLGRTYFQESLNSLVIPLRKSISIDGKNVDAVMTAGLRLDSTIVFENNAHAGSYNTLTLLRPDNYRQFYSSDIESLEAYLEPVDNDVVTRIIHRFAQQVNVSLEEAKTGNNTYSFSVDDDMYHSLVSAKYIPDYKLWVVGRTDLTHVDSIFIQEFGILFGAFIFLQFGFYVLVKSIAKNEQRTRSQLIYQANHDPLTSLPNRLYMRRNIDKWIEDESEQFSLLFIDIDNFKCVNDTHGHDFGDKVLKQIALRLMRFRSRLSLLVRESSDEFLFLTPLTNESEIKRLAERIIEVLSQPYEVEHSQFLLGCSIGIARFPEHGKDLDSLLRSADISMYKAKQQQNSYSIFTTAMQDAHLYKMRVEQRLRIAIEKQTLFMAFQPLVRTDKSTHGVEALVRWIDDELGFVPPDVFIPVAESTGLMQKLGTFIIESSIMQIAHLHRTTEQKIGLSINISVRQFSHKSFSDHLFATLEKYQFSPSCLTLEITESLFIEDVAIVKPLFEALKENDIKISLDDFGTGYSSLSMLKALPIDELKIDKSFIENIAIDQQSLTMVQNIIAIGKNFGMVVLAEGVESNEHFSILKACGCDLMQGYYFSRPIPYDELCEYLAPTQVETIELPEPTA
ncbi:diguanylate cyclase [Vibrio crassostreae]|uniref:Putative EAL and GGDEF domains protein n=1 Tax=Vibrio crassostreae TaxID=246167 RepID=A0A822N166_9VIBR|nr:EAL domain-containing protein [Vibrio crassostreae]MDH5952430.1 EAL domain-containing protein [Vibrio crassostreae]TCN04316.1 diguanylate cyclase/phosphodiesterase [Vibrio crassostreae]TCT57510.1 diguanylate cyclase/phosphodiesterase [Vibrio crassostreae]TCT72800.1 diguanylate cyclase/phosphodiesterase [Vibrio crassostreae]TCT77926.1 diguanylate cyclase/phosphodiesterase [Vibrio crassostreae]